MSTHSILSSGLWLKKKKSLREIGNWIIERIPYIRQKEESDGFWRLPSSLAYFSFRRLINNVPVLLFKVLCMANKLLHFNWLPLGLPGGSDGEESACNTGDLGLIPGWRRCPGGGNGSPLQYSCLENPLDKGAWWATVHGVTNSPTRLRDKHFHFHFGYVSVSSVN